MRRLQGCISAMMPATITHWKTSSRRRGSSRIGYFRIAPKVDASLFEADAERALFRDLNQRLLDGIADTHVSLVLTGGNADAAGIDTFLSAPYSSLAVDLIAGPDNWRLVVAAPRDVGIVCGAVSPKADSDDGPETLLWAAGYAASTAGRGLDRVGLATASSLSDLEWDVAIAKLERLGAVLGVCFGVVNLAFSWLAPLSDDSIAALLRFYGPMFFLWAFVSYRAARRDRPLVSGMLAGLVVAFATFTVFDVLNLVRVNLFLPDLADRADWRRLTARCSTGDVDSLRACITMEYVRATPLKIGTATLIGAAMGVVGGTLARTRSWVSPAAT